MIDFYKQVAEKFYNWALEYVKPNDGKNIREYSIEIIIALLIVDCIFTEEQLRAELKERKIPIHEKYFNASKYSMEIIRGLK